MLFVFNVLRYVNVGKFCQRIVLNSHNGTGGLPLNTLIGDKRIVISEHLVFQLSCEYVNKVNR